MKTAKTMKRMLAVFCVVALVFGMIPATVMATETATGSVTKLNYQDAMGTYSTEFRQNTTKYIQAKHVDEAIKAAPQVVGTGLEYTFDLTLERAAYEPVDAAVIAYAGFAINAFLPSDLYNSNNVGGYGVRIWLNKNYIRFSPSWVDSEADLGKNVGTFANDPTYTEANGQGYKYSASVDFSNDASLKAKMLANGEAMRFILGFKIHEIKDDGTVVVEYYFSVDGKLATSIYVPINTVVENYKGATRQDNACYNTVGGGAMRVSSGVVRIYDVAGGTKLTDANDTRFTATLSDVRTANMIPECDATKGTMLINGQEGTVVYNGTANVTVAPNSGEKLMGLMVGSKFITAPAAVAGVYTFTNITVPLDQDDVTVKAVFENVTKLNYMDAMGTYSTEFRQYTTKYIQAKHVDEVIEAAPQVVGTGLEYTFDLTLEKAAYEPADAAVIAYSGFDIRAFLPSDLYNSNHNGGYGVRIWLNKNYIRFSPNWVDSEADLGKNVGTFANDPTYTEADGQGYKYSASVDFSNDASLKAKLLANGEAMRFVIGFKIHEIKDDGTVVVEYYFSVDGKLATSIYVPVNTVVENYKGATRQDATCYNTVGGGAMRVSLEAVRIYDVAGGTKLTDPNDTRFTATLSDVRPHVCTPAEAVKENEIPATCTTAGSYDLVVKCSECGEVMSTETVTVDALGHAWNDGVIDPDATCTSDGVKTFTCGTCGETKTEAVSAKGHTAADAVKENEKDATCTEDGSYDMVVYCSVCGAELSRETTTVEAAGHKYVPVETAPTCGAAGYTTYTCACGDTYKEDGAPATGEHTYDNDQDADCNTCGAVREVEPQEPTDSSLVYYDVPGLSFQDYIGLQVLVQNSVAKNYDSFYVEIIQVDANGKESRTTTEGVIYYKYYTLFEQQVLSCSMTEAITMTLYGVKDDVAYKGDSFTVTVAELALSKIPGYVQGGDMARAKALVDMLNFGAAVQEAYDYNETNLANANLGDLAQYGTTTPPTLEAVKNITGTESIKIDVDNISMQSKVEFQFMLRTSKLGNNTIVAQWADDEASVELMPYGSYTIIRVACPAARMRDTLTFKIVDAEGNALTMEFKVSVEAYAAATIAGDAGKAPVMHAMINYGDSAASIK